MRSCGLKRNFDPSLSHPEESKLVFFLRIKVSNRSKFYLSASFAWKGEHLMTKHAHFILPCEVRSFPLKSRTPAPFSSVLNDIYTPLCWSLEFPGLCAFPYVCYWILFSPGNLFYVNLFLSPVRRTFEGPGILASWHSLCIPYSVKLWILLWYLQQKHCSKMQRLLQICLKSMTSSSSSMDCHFGHLIMTKDLTASLASSGSAFPPLPSL